ncbi:MAG: hypothetical protein K9W44_05485 [Candidatus Lokiarchaeota archaeon]|nr:hypothetical protein [Candidatus Harpocratesius repetitus]
MAEQISAHHLALIWGTLRNIVDFNYLEKSVEIMLIGAENGEFPIHSYQKIYIELPKNQTRIDLSSRSNNHSPTLNSSPEKNNYVKNQWINQRLIRLPRFYIKKNSSELINLYKSLIKNWNSTQIPSDIPCFALALKVIGDYSNEREAQFVRVLLIWENKIARIIDLEYFEGPLEDCISPEWYINSFNSSNLYQVSKIMTNVQAYLPKWTNQSYSLHIIPSFLTNFLKYGKKGFCFENGWKYEYNYLSINELNSDLSVILDLIKSFF